MKHEKPKLRLVEDTDDEAELASMRIDGGVSPVPPLEEAPEVIPKRGGRQFTRFENEWAKRLIANKSTVGMWRMSLVLLRKADFADRFPVTAKTMREAGLSRWSKQDVLKRLEALGLIRVEWRGRRAPIVTAGYLTGRRTLQRWPERG
jgi:hypothetical protein